MYPGGRRGLENWVVAVAEQLVFFGSEFPSQSSRL